ncbi:carbohydrate phosphatase [Parathielavia appendiculata]|uniref:Carbohydrate phosphatase n=1 Tax=Parathielavia appendiculata TaxID=2587402 RepID=A0AAN6TR28_9PEZI|nr:carbohydrate phosphatase [Parathielavia appendiculata]
MTVPSLTPNTFAHELLIAQLAVQRAALVTKRVLATINATKSISQPSSPIADTPTTPTILSQYLHPEYYPISPLPISPTSDDNTSNSPFQFNLPRRLSLAKTDTSPVTVADLAAQALLIAAIHSAFPCDTILGEEDAADLRADADLAEQVWELVSTTRLDDAESEALLGRPGSLDEMLEVIDLGGGNHNHSITKDARNGSTNGSSSATARGGGKRFWCLDPIDGTSAYMKGGQYAISVALLQDGKELLGVLGCPNWRFEEGMGTAVGERWTVQENVLDVGGMGLMLAAVRGQGATVRPMGRGALSEGRRVDRGKGKPVELREVHLVDSQRSPATLTEKVEELAKIAGATYPAVTNLYSSHMRYAAMALGGREFAQLRWPKPGKGPWSIWDHAGSQLIYTESGAGKVTDLAGNPIDFSTGNKLSRSWGVITADESVHAEILSLVNQMRAASP